MKLDHKTTAIIVLSILVLILGWVAFKPKPNPYNNELEKMELERLKSENKVLLQSIASRDVKIGGFTAKIDSLESLKPKIKIMYDTIYKKIDNSSAGTIASEFTDVFSNAGIK